MLYRWRYGNTNHNNYVNLIYAYRLQCIGLVLFCAHRETFISHSNKWNPRIIRVLAAEINASWARNHDVDICQVVRGRPNFRQQRIRISLPWRFVTYITGALLLVTSSEPLWLLIKLKWMYHGIMVSIVNTYSKNIREHKWYSSPHGKYFDIFHNYHLR